MSDLIADDLGESNVTTDLIAGSVGDGVAVKFVNHRKFASQLPMPSDILDGKVKDLKIKEISAMYSLVVSMCYELQDAAKKMTAGKDKDKWHEMANNFFEYMMANFTVELVVMGARVALATYKLPLVTSKLKSFSEFDKKYGKYILAAAAK